MLDSLPVFLIMFLCIYTNYTKVSQLISQWYTDV